MNLEGETMKLQDLPDCMLEQIFEHLSYDEISKKRLVSVLCMYFIMDVLYFIRTQQFSSFYY